MDSMTLNIFGSIKQVSADPMLSFLERLPPLNFLGLGIDPIYLIYVMLKGVNF